MSSNAISEAKSILEPGEALLWSGEPDREVMLKTLGKKPFNPTFALGMVAVIGGVLWLNQDKLESVGLGELLQSVPGLVVGLLPIAAVAFGIIYFRRRKARSYVDALSYHLTDRRALILLGGGEFDSYTPAQVGVAELRERAGAPGYHDIVWTGQGLEQFFHRGSPDAIALERVTLGFKALKDGPAVMARLSEWLKEHNVQA